MRLMIFDKKLAVTCNIAKKGFSGIRSSSPASSFVLVDSDALRNPFQAILPPLGASERHRLKFDEKMYI
jgi:hypothetical protein